MLAFCDGDVTKEKLRLALRRLHLSKKYLRHFESLCVWLVPNYSPMRLDAQVRFEMMKKFRVIEFWWDKVGRQIDPTRKIFFSYPFLFYQFCLEMNLSQIVSRKDQYLLKNKKALAKQEENYKKIQQYIAQNIC